MPTGDNDANRARLIGQRIAKARLAAGFAHAKDAADALGISRSLYTSYERGERLDVVSRWINVMEWSISPTFGVSSAYLMGLIDDAAKSAEISIWTEIGKAIIDTTGQGVEWSKNLFSIVVDRPMKYHDMGDILFFECTTTLNGDGLYAIHTASGMVARWAYKMVDGGWRLNDGNTDEYVTDERAEAMPVRGKYRFKMTDL